MSFSMRPTKHEIDQKLVAARKAVKAKKHRLGVDLVKLFGDLNDLDIGDVQEVWPVIEELLGEIALENYAGGYPPQSARERIIQDEELYAFSWPSKRYQKKMYLKFALMDGFFYLVSLHESRRSRL